MTNNLKNNQLHSLMNTDILQNVKKIRELMNLSQDAMAEKMNITQSAYARFETGKSKTDLENLKKFCSVTNYSLVDLITYPEKYISIGEIREYVNFNNPKAKIVVEIDMTDMDINKIDLKERIENKVFNFK